MKKLLLSLFVGIVFLHLSCSRDKELSNDVEAKSQVQIRIRNTSLLPFENIEVNTSGGVNEFGTVADNQLSDYKTFDFAYRYSFVKLNINGEPYIIQPIDYTGEHKLESGKYTYEIHLDPESNQIFMNLAND
ncbi:hypothetical protein [Dyadobacter frigoris]|uniref:Uncharacterized protein n=1 Tax=Dyadobacter frigoris TaxID=2576211 RepID=A0A4U6D0J4_9BACT|nr:hypothetical protein [Dyadobacter frigoris]TKT90116.1 hypothetical protein FDK13_20460 [Dyadobacter frigoris]GLU52343.1 hypothetical protein Dfri01_18040 [Dyadobacter frigoris]